MNNNIEQGYVKLHRKIQDTSFYKKSEILHLFIHLLLSAAHKPQKIIWNNKELIIETGQVLTGRKQLSKDTGISEQSVRTCITTLKSTNTITIKSTSKFSIISILNWQTYQGKSTNETTSKLTNNQPATNQQLTTYKNDKNVKNDKNKDLCAFAKKENFDFDAVWQLYPRRLGKKAAERHFNASVKTESDYNNILKAVNNYITHIKAEGTAEKYIKHGSTFFNNWQDWVDYKGVGEVKTAEMIADEEQCAKVMRRYEVIKQAAKRVSIDLNKPKNYDELVSDEVRSKGIRVLNEALGRQNATKRTEMPQI